MARYKGEIGWKVMLRGCFTHSLIRFHEIWCLRRGYLCSEEANGWLRRVKGVYRAKKLSVWGL